MAASFYDLKINYANNFDTNTMMMKFDGNHFSNHYTQQSNQQRLTPTTMNMINGGGGGAAAAAADVVVVGSNNTNNNMMNHCSNDYDNCMNNNNSSNNNQLFDINQNQTDLFNALSSINENFSQISFNNNNNNNDNNINDSDTCNLNDNQQQQQNHHRSSANKNQYHSFENDNNNHNNNSSLNHIKQSLQLKLITIKRLQQEIQNNYDDSIANYHLFILQLRQQLDVIMQNIDDELNDYYKQKLIELNERKSKIEELIEKLDEHNNDYHENDIDNLKNSLETLTIDINMMDKMTMTLMTVPPIANVDQQMIDNFIRSLIFPLRHQHQQQQASMFEDQFNFDNLRLSSTSSFNKSFSDHQQHQEQSNNIITPQQWSQASSSMQQLAQQQPLKTMKQQNNLTKITSSTMAPTLSSNPLQNQYQQQQNLIHQLSFDHFSTQQPQQQHTDINTNPSSFNDTKNQFFSNNNNINDDFPIVSSFINDQHNFQLQSQFQAFNNGSLIHPSLTNPSINDLNILNQKQAITKSLQPKLRRERINYYLKFGEQGIQQGQFAEPSGVAVNPINDDIYIADANNHRVQVFDKWGKFKFNFGEGKLKFPNRVALSHLTGEIVVSERPPVHQIQVYNKNGIFQCKFGAKHLRHPRGLAIDHQNRIVVVECKVIRVFVFSLQGVLLHSFDCSERIQFPNAVAVSRTDEIFISDNRNHCVKVFNFNGDFLRQIGGQGITNYPIGVCLNETLDQLLVIDNYNNLNVTLFRTDGQLIGAYESSAKHQQCLDVALFGDQSIVVTSKDLQVYFYRLKDYIQSSNNANNSNNNKQFINVNNNNNSNGRIPSSSSSSSLKTPLTMTNTTATTTTTAPSSTTASSTTATTTALQSSIIHNKNNCHINNMNLNTNHQRSSSSSHHHL